MGNRRTIADRYEKAAANLLRQHRVTASWIEARYWKHAMAFAEDRRVSCPRPRDCQTFYLFCHELAHVILQHKSWPTTSIGQAEELDADAWALRRIKRVRGYIPATILRQTESRLAYTLAALARRGMLGLASTARFLREKQT